jgi:hypothetical protein
MSGYFCRGRFHHLFAFFSLLQYPLHTVLASDSRQQALPVAWVITRSVTKQDTLRWMQALTSRINSVDSTWRIGGFIVDDPTSELDPIRYSIDFDI